MVDEDEGRDDERNFVINSTSRLSAYSPVVCGFSRKEKLLVKVGKFQIFGSCPFRRSKYCNKVKVEKNAFLC